MEPEVGKGFTVPHFVTIQMFTYKQLEWLHYHETDWCNPLVLPGHAAWRLHHMIIYSVAADNKIYLQFSLHTMSAPYKRINQRISSYKVFLDQMIISQLIKTCMYFLKWNKFEQFRDQNEEFLGPKLIFLQCKLNPIEMHPRRGKKK